MFSKRFLNFFKNINDFWGSSTSKLRQLRISSFSSKLKLAFTYFNKFRATLYKSINLSKNRILIKFPFNTNFFLSISFLLFLLFLLLFLFLIIMINQLLNFFIYFFPIFSAFNRISQITHAFFNISIKHILYIYLRFASFNNFI
jgi:hypothetical protein